MVNKMRLKEEILLDEARELAALIFDVMEIHFPSTDPNIAIMALRICMEQYEKRKCPKTVILGPTNNITQGPQL